MILCEIDNKRFREMDKFCECSVFTLLFFTSSLKNKQTGCPWPKFSAWGFRIGFHEHTGDITVATSMLYIQSSKKAY